jgi:hypothetical protein
MEDGVVGDRGDFGIRVTCPGRGASEGSDAFRAHIPNRSCGRGIAPVGGIRQSNPFAYSIDPQFQRILMPVRRADPSLVSVPLPSEEELTRAIGESYVSEKVGHESAPAR